jgi:hypothetical protein
MQSVQHSRSDSNFRHCCHVAVGRDELDSDPTSSRAGRAFVVAKRGNRKPTSSPSRTSMAALSPAPGPCSPAESKKRLAENECSPSSQAETKRGASVDCCLRVKKVCVDVGSLPAVSTDCISPAVGKCNNSYSRKSASSGIRSFLCGGYSCSCWRPFFGQDRYRHSCSRGNIRTVIYLPLIVHTVYC